MTLIDTAEIYGDGRAEELIKHVMADQRDRVFLVSKVANNHVIGDGIALACEASLARLGTDHLDLYLLHWPAAGAAYSEVVAEFESLRAVGKIGAWGVSNFTVPQMEDLFRVPRGDRCATNQVRYSLADRQIENDVLTWCRQHGMPVMAYSPLGGAETSLLRDPVLTRIAAEHSRSVAWTIRDGNVIAIPESGSAAHVKENSAALSLTLTPQDLHALDAAHPSLSRFEYWAQPRLARPSKSRLVKLTVRSGCLHHRRALATCTWRSTGFALPLARAPVAQLDRAPDFESGGQGFESLPARQ